MVREGVKLLQRFRIALAWVLSVMLVGTYLWLPTTGRVAKPAADFDDGEPARVDVVNVSPPQSYPGGVLVIDYVNANEPVLKVYLGKVELAILSQRIGTVVARLPTDAEPGRGKIRVGRDGERSKPYVVRIEARDWRQPFRDFLGGLALLVFGVGVFARGAREAAGKGSASTLHHSGQHPLLAFGFGTLLGGMAQSTLAAAAFIAGVSASNLVSTGAAAAAFIGAQVGAGVVPLITGLLDPRVGLLIVAVGVLWLGVANDRRVSAFARLVLGAGLIAYGLHLLRSGIEPLVIDKTLLRLSAGLHANSIAGVLVCVVIGALLVAFLQGAASALFVVVGLLQTVGQLDLRVVLAVLAGSGLGAALGAVLTTRGGVRGRNLSQLHLLLGAGNTLIAVLTLDLWVNIATRIAPSSEPIAGFGAHTLMPHLSAQLAWALVLSQVGNALLVLPLLGPINRWLKKSAAIDPEAVSPASAPAVVRERLLSLLHQQRVSLQSISELVLGGQRNRGRDAEQQLTRARAELDELLSRVVRVLPATGEGAELRQLAFSCLQLQRSFEDLLFRAERFTDKQVALAARGRSQSGLGEYEAVTREMQDLLLQSMDAAIEALQQQLRVDLSEARGREIRLNALEAQSRRALLESSGDSAVIQVRLDVLELLDSYEGAGNHLYRVAETLTGDVSAYRSASG